VPCSRELLDRQILVVANEHPSGGSSHDRRTASIWVSIVGRVFGPFGLVARVSAIRRRVAPLTRDSAL
jgi:hypothetical protein